MHGTAGDHLPEGADFDRAWRPALAAADLTRDTEAIAEATRSAWRSPFVGDPPSDAELQLVRLASAHPAV
jgi:hypothetical protein